MGYKRETVEKLTKFRRNMGSDLFMQDAKRIFRSTLTYLPDEGINEVSEKKLQYARTYVKYLKVFNLVKFIGVTGSVGAGIAKEGDDIDVFIIVKNNTLWIYRGLMLVRNLFNNKVRNTKSVDEKDLICPNLIAEERGLTFDNDIFNLHELYYLKPIYNAEYFEKILASNQWVTEWGGVVEKFDKKMKRMNIFLEAINLYFFLSQLLYMMVKGNKPEVSRIFNNYLKGRVEFFLSDFKYDKLKKLESVKIN